MTDITNQQRREVAARLREEDARTVPLVYGGYAIADLIDRPTCRAVQPAPGAFYECTRCGYDGWADAESVTRYCPECGAEAIA